MHGVHVAPQCRLHWLTSMVSPGRYLALPCHSGKHWAAMHGDMSQRLPVPVSARRSRDGQVRLTQGATARPVHDGYKCILQPAKHSPATCPPARMLLVVSLTQCKY